MISKGLYSLFFLLILSTIICFSEGWAQTDCESLRQQLVQVRTEFGEIEARWKNLPPGKEKERLEAQLHKLDDRRLKIRQKLKDLGCNGRFPWWVIVAIVIAIASISVVLINLRKGRQKRPPRPKEPDEEPGAKEFFILPIKDPVVLAAIISAITSIIVALIGLVR